MENNPYVKYYVNQAGNGLRGFEGVRYQKGHGFFGRLISSFAKPLLGYLGKKAFNTGTTIARDVIGGEKFKVAGKRRLREAMENIGRDARRKVDQMGSGYTPRLQSKTFKKKKKGIKPRKSKNTRSVNKKPSKKKRGKILVKKSIKKSTQPSKPKNKGNKKIKFLE